MDKRKYWLCVEGASARLTAATTTNYEHGIRSLRRFVKTYGGAGAILATEMTVLPPASHSDVLYYVRRDTNGKLKVATHILPEQYAK